MTVVCYFFSIVGFELIMFWVIIFLEYLGLVWHLGNAALYNELEDFLFVSTF